MQKKIKGKRKKAYIILGAILTIILLNAIIYCARAIMPLHIDFKEENSSINTYSASQGNYIAVSQENGLRQFPFVMGGRLSLLSIADGKFYTVKDNKKFLGGFVYPTLQGENVYYFDGWDGSPQFLYATNLKNKTERKLILKQVDQYAISGNQLFYTKGDSDTSLYCKNLRTDKQRILLRGGESTTLSYLSVVDGVLYFSDTNKGLLYAKRLDSDKIKKYHISDIPNDWVGAVQPLNKYELLIATGKSGIINYNTSNGVKSTVAELGDISRLWNYESIYSFCYVNGELYYYDKTYATYKLNLETKQKVMIIDWSNIETVKDYIKDIENLRMFYSYCPDYIAVEILYYNSEIDSSDHRVVAFDYDGKLVLDKPI